jgi:hypothetical protein
MSVGLKPAVLEIENHWLEYPSGIPIESWGRDHHSALLYAETRAVDHGGRLDQRHMRTARDYPTRLNNGVLVIGHTDYDCLADAQHAGLLTWDENEEVVRFTEAGWAYVGKLRRERAERATTPSR